MKAKNFDEDLVDSNNWTRQYEKPNDAAPHRMPPQSSPTFVETGQSRRCFSCGELKPVQSYNKNEKRKGVEARCITCVATNPGALDVSTICPACKATALNDGEAVCQPCLTRMASALMKRTPVKRES